MNGLEPGVSTAVEMEAALLLIVVDCLHEIAPLKANRPHTTLFPNGVPYTQTRRVQRSAL